MAVRHDASAAVPPEQSPSPAGEHGKAPKFETPTPAEAGGPVPRVINGIERAAGGLKRFKLRVLNYAPPVQPWKYVLAKDEEQARAHYLEVTGLKKEMDRLAKNRAKDGPPIEQPDFVVRELSD